GIFDSRKMQRAFFNLLLNACEAVPNRDGRVDVEITRSEDSFEVRVADNGLGVPEPIVSNLFDPFVSLGKPNGTGLGLAIVKKIIHDHEGTVELVRTSQEGTVFCVKWPRAVRADSLPASPSLV